MLACTSREGQLFYERSFIEQYIHFEAIIFSFDSAIYI